MLYTISVRGEDDVFVDMELTFNEFKTLEWFVLKYTAQREEEHATYASHIEIAKKKEGS